MKFSNLYSQSGIWIFLPAQLLTLPEKKKYDKVIFGIWKLRELVRFRESFNAFQWQFLWVKIDWHNLWAYFLNPIQSARIFSHRVKMGTCTKQLLWNARHQNNFQWEICLGFRGVILNFRFKTLENLMLVELCDLGSLRNISLLSNMQLC